MAAKHSGLGRGFGEFFQRTDVDDDEHDEDAPSSDVDGSTYQLVDVDEIRPNSRQPRTVFDEDALDELAASIRTVGVLQPIVVTPCEGGYELVMGERRWRAASRAGLTEIPAIVRTTATQDMLRDALLENLHRVQLNPLEEAAAYEQMLEDFGCTQDELSERLGRSRSQIANTIRLLKLSAPVQKHLLEGDLTAGHARTLLALTDPEAQTQLANRIVGEGLSVRATEQLVRSMLDDTTEVKPHLRKKPGRDARAAELAGELSERLSTHVTVKRRNGKGTITLAFNGDEDLERLVDILSNR